MTAFYDELDSDRFDDYMESAHMRGEHEPEEYQNADCWICQRNQEEDAK